MSIVLKYDSAIYQAKIDTFKSLNDRLNSHLETLERLKSQVTSAWYDEFTDAAMQNIATAITRVRNASEQVNRLSGVYQEIVSEQTRLGTAIDASVEQMGESINKVDGVINIAASLKDLGV